MTDRKKKSRKRNAGRDSIATDRIRERIWVASLFVVAWLHRVFFLRSNSDQDWGFSIFYEGDAETFYNYARSILADVPYDLGIPFHPPFFAHLLAFVHQLVGAGDPTARVPQETVRILLAGVGAAIIPTLYVLVRPYLGRVVAAVSAILCLYHFGMNVISVAPVSESLYLLLLLAALLLWSRLGGHPWGVPLAASNLRQRLQESPALRILCGAGLGILLGLLSLTRAEGISIAILLLVIGGSGNWIADRREALQTAAASKQNARQNPQQGAPRQRTSPRPSTKLGQRRSHAWIVAGLALVLVILPWTIRNARNLSRVNEQMKTELTEPLPTFVPLTIYGPLNFALANNELATGEFSRAYLTSQSTSASLDLSDPQHLRFLLHGSKIGAEFIRNHPGDWAGLVVQKWSLFFGALRLGWTQWDLPGGLDGVRRPVDIFVPDSPAGIWFALPWLVLGIAVLRRSGRTEGRWLALVLGFTGLTAATTALFFGYARLGLLCLPFWATLIAAAIVWLCRRVFVRGIAADPGSRTDSGLFASTAFRVIVIVMIAMFLLEAWGATGNRDFVAKGTQFEGASHLNPHDTMRLSVVRD